MPHTLASLVNHSALKLTVLAGEERLDAPVRWAHASELIDPVPYMEGGELLLITALKLDAEDAEAMRTYVRRVAGAGVVGLGFAVGVNYEGVPDALVEAAGRRTCRCSEVPRQTPFIAISKAVSAADRRRPVPGGDRRLRGPAGTDPRRARTRRPGRTARPARRPPRRLGRPLRRLGRRRRRRPRLGRPPRRPAHRRGRSGCGNGPPRPAPSSATPTSDDRVELQSLGTGRRARGASPSAPARRSARPSATPCTPRSRC